MLNGLPAYCSIWTDRNDALGQNRAHGTFQATRLKGSPNLGTSYLSGVEHGNLETVKTLVAHQWTKSQVLQSNEISSRCRRSACWLRVLRADLVEPKYAS